MPSQHSIRYLDVAAALPRAIDADRVDAMARGLASVRERDGRLFILGGDTDADVLAGRAAGCHTLPVENEASFRKRGGQAQPDVVVPSLPSAVDMLLRTEERTSGQ